MEVLTAPQFMVQGGDITAGDGTGGRSIFGSDFAGRCHKRRSRLNLLIVKREDESFAIKHDRAGILSMGNRGPNSNTSQVSPLHRSHLVLDLLPELTTVLHHHSIHTMVRPSECRIR